MKIYAISDLHLSFNENIDKPMDVFGTGWENHAERLRAIWKEYINEEDIVLVPGDISWGLKLEEAMADFDWLHLLPGKKIISKGNHDLWWSRINYLNTLYDDIIFLQNDCYVPEDSGIVITASRGWPYPGSDEYTEHDEKIYARELQRLRLGLDAAKAKAPEADIIVCLHYPPSDPSGRVTGFTEILEEYNVRKCVYGHLHGHAAFGRGIKGKFRGIDYQLVSLDYLGAQPKLIYDSQDPEKEVVGR
ncbi:MAG: metallophosphoesterase [Mogibacterium sp.]|nr:metallophosphoesterase [Mogibacterium sp.]